MVTEATAAKTKQNKTKTFKNSCEINYFIVKGI